MVRLVDDATLELELLRRAEIPVSERESAGAVIRRHQDECAGMHSLKLEPLPHRIVKVQNLVEHGARVVRGCFRNPVLVAAA